MRKTHSTPGIKGGQGRSDESVNQDGKTVVRILLGIALLVITLAVAL